MIWKLFGVVLITFLYFVWGGHGATIKSDLSTSVSPERFSDLCEYKEQYYFNETRKCYYPTNLISRLYLPRENYSNDTTNPCGELQYFYKASRPYGACDCVREEGDCNIGVFNRPVLNWSGGKRCYYAYSKGPCNSGEWLIMNPKTFQSECKPNPCQGLKLQAPIKTPRKPEIEVFWFTKGNTCYQTFTKAFCKEDQYAKFEGTSQYPSCFPTQFNWPCAVATATTTSLPCSQGTKKIGDKCVPEVEIDD